MVKRAVSCSGVNASADKRAPEERAEPSERDADTGELPRWAPRPGCAIGVVTEDGIPVSVKELAVLHAAPSLSAVVCVASDSVAGSGGFAEADV